MSFSPVFRLFCIDILSFYMISPRINISFRIFFFIFYTLYGLSPYIIHALNSLYLQMVLYLCFTTVYSHQEFLNFFICFDCFYKVSPFVNSPFGIYYINCFIYYMVSPRILSISCSQYYISWISPFSFTNFFFSFFYPFSSICTLTLPQIYYPINL